MRFRFSILTSLTYYKLPIIIFCCRYIDSDSRTRLVVFVLQCVTFWIVTMNVECEIMNTIKSGLFIFHAFKSILIITLCTFIFKYIQHKIIECLIMEYSMSSIRYIFLFGSTSSCCKKIFFVLYNRPQ